MPQHRTATRFLVNALLRLLAMQFNLRPSLKRYLRGEDGWIDFTVALRTEDRSIEAGVSFLEGRVTPLKAAPQNADVALIFADQSAIHHMLRVTPNEVLNMLMHNRIRTEGNFTLLNLFNFYLSLVLGRFHRRMEKKRQVREKKWRDEIGAKASGRPHGNVVSTTRLRAESIDPGVKYLPEPYLADLSLGDFPRLKRFVDIHFETKPLICHERPLLLTRWFKENGFEMKRGGEPWPPELRQALALKHLMENREPIIREGDLIAGTTTKKEIGVVLYPDAHGTLIWGELHSVPHRELNPYGVDEETIEVLHHEVFPYWIHRNFREWVREKHGNPLSQRIDERFAVYFVWKSVGISHTIPDFPKLLRLGTEGIASEIDGALGKTHDADQKTALAAMKITLEAMDAYAANLSKQAAADAEACAGETRRGELHRLSEICARVPRQPARSLDEAVNAIWIAWVTLHMENSNTGLSLGRLDRWLQPYFEADLQSCADEAARDAAIRRAVELTGCLFMRCTDHLPLIPDIGNYLFGGSSSDQAITVGGLTEDGGDAVCDMTYVLLKATELLGIRDPNVNARYAPGVNSQTYLKRLCEVNRITRATPSLHNDDAVMASLREFGYPEDALRDWSATGCVEPTLSGRHMGHTGSMLMSMVAPLEMALFGGKHPLMNWRPGPGTGTAFATFEDFFGAYTAQFGFLIDEAVSFNNLLGEAHALIRPTPLLSALIDGCIETGRDVTRGGARFNSSGTSQIGLADVTDSLMAIKTLVFDEKKVTFDELRAAVTADFEGHERLLAMIETRVPRFGSGSEEAIAMARRVSMFVHDRLGAHCNYRGGPYTAGFWSMSNHVAYGTLAGALPSGRRKGKAFTPGLTPYPGASKNLLDNLRDVAGLDARAMNNNMAFNVKVVPGTDAHEKTVDTMKGYVGAYFDLGGMQMQMNVVDAATLRAAMARPDEYRNLLVRISGYNAYFVTLNRDMQIELIERSEYGIA